MCTFWFSAARNIVRRERFECTCSPLNREFDISDTRGCDGEGVCTYRLVVQLLPIVLGPTCRLSTLPVQTQISTTRVSSRKSSDGHKHRLYSPWFLIRSTRGTSFRWGRYISDGEKYEQSFYAFEWSNRRVAHGHGQSTYKPLAGVTFTGVQYAFSLLTRTVGHNREKHIVPICSQKPYSYQNVSRNVAFVVPPHATSRARD